MVECRNAAQLTAVVGRSAAGLSGPVSCLSVPRSARSAREPRRRLGVMGGTFDPIHHGHLVAASEVADLFGLDEVDLRPDGPALAEGDRQVSPPEDRYLMTVIATASNPRFSVSRVDIDRGTATYTIDTLRDLREAASRRGAVLHHRRRRARDQILTWQDREELFDLARFVGVSRPATNSPPHISTNASTSCRTVRSASSRCPRWPSRPRECRERASEGRPVWYLVPDGVVQYIDKRHLYRATASRGRRPRRDRSPIRATGATRKAAR